MQAVDSGWTFASVHGDLLLKRNALHADGKDLSQLTDEDIKKMEDDLKFREREHLKKQQVIQEKIVALQAEMEQMNQNCKKMFESPRSRVSSSWHSSNQFKPFKRVFNSLTRWKRPT